MKPTRTPHTNSTLILPGGTADNDLPAEHTVDEQEQPCIISTWSLDAAERAAIAAGAAVDLIVWGDQHPPVAMRIATLDR